MPKPTVFDLRCIPCGCDHEKVGRNKFAMSNDVIRAVKTCTFAMDGLMIGCAHVHSTAGFFIHDGRQILAHAMTQSGIENVELDRLYAIKGYLDVLKRRACGRYFPMDATVKEMQRSDTMLPFLRVGHPLKDILSYIFYYAENPPKDTEGIRLCDMYFFNADKYIADAINIILQSVQSRLLETA